MLSMPPAHRCGAIHAAVAHALAASLGDATHAHGYDILRWFLKGWIAHPDPDTQGKMLAFHYATDMEGTIIPANSAQGYAILRAAHAGALINTLPKPAEAP